jgi:uncharacterized RDD family membrane protein YckC
VINTKLRGCIPDSRPDSRPVPRLRIANRSHLEWDARRVALAAGEIRIDFARHGQPNPDNARISPRPLHLRHTRRDTGALRQSAQQVDNTLTWKQEVNRRVAEHNGRKGQPATSQNAPADNSAAGSAAAKAAARVAARYAKAPSYSQMLADEARAAVRAAEAASMAALQAQAAAESVLAGLEAVSSATQATQTSHATQPWESEFFTPAVPEPAPFTPVRIAPAEPVHSVSHSASRAAARPSSAREPFEIRWDADMPVRESGPAVSRSSHGNNFETPAENQWQSEPDLRSPLETQGFELVEPALPIHANLIEFPRELVATRKIRPRRAEGPYAESVASLAQLSIFEVDPGAFSFEPPAPISAAEANAATWVGPDPSGHVQSGAKWSGLELDEEPQQEIAIPAPAASLSEKAEPIQLVLPMQTAPMNRRLMAAVVDFSLITTSFLASAVVATLDGMTLHSLRFVEVGTAAALPLIGVLYLAFFFTLAKATPGMKYAGLEICTFAGEKATRFQRLARIPVLLLSVAPMGIGAAWAIFDEQHLCWHDRLSGTYIRRA